MTIAPSPAIGAPPDADGGDGPAVDAPGDDATPPDRTSAPHESGTPPDTTGPDTTGPDTTGPDTTGVVTTTPAEDAPTTTEVRTPEPTDQASTVPPTTNLPDGSVPAPAALEVFGSTGRIGHILATIRYLESRGIYTLPPNRGNASGAYQFIASTWANHAGYPHAHLAPPAVQDARALADVLRFLDRWNDDVSMIPVMWYYPAAATDPALMDIVPVPSAGNVLTVREYQQRWLGVFAAFSGHPVPIGPTPAQALPDVAMSVDGAPPVVPVRADGEPSLSFPVLGPARPAIPDCDGAVRADGAPTRADIEAAGLCRDDAPGIVFGVKLQPVLSATDGVVTDVVDDPGSGDPITVTVTDVGGRSYVYAGFNDDSPGTDDGAAPPHLRLTPLARVGNTVRAGQMLGFMGDSSPLPVGVRAAVPLDDDAQLDPDAVAPHIRLSIYERDGRAIDAYGPVIDAILRQTCDVVAGPWSSPPHGAANDAVSVGAGDEGDAADSRWDLLPSGQVQATGWAAMINPNATCDNVPNEPHGPGGAGLADPPAGWDVPIDLPTDVWVDLALQDTGSRPDFLLRP